MRGYVALILIVLSAAVAVSAQELTVVGAQVRIAGEAWVWNYACYPGPDFGDFLDQTFVSGVNGNDGFIRNEVYRTQPTPPMMLCTPPYRSWVTARSSCIAWYDGDLTDRVSMEYWLRAQSEGWPTEYESECLSDLEFRLFLEITGGPQGFPVTLYYSWDHFGGIGEEHEAVLEDRPTWTTAEVWFSKTGELLQDRFDFDAGTIFGWNQKKNQAASYNSFIGDTLVIDVFLHGHTKALPPAPTPAVQTLDKQQACQVGRFRVSVGNVITPEPPDSLFASWLEFSVDIGGDAELSDPTPDGNEAFDPGDAYHWQGPPIFFPGVDGIRDDSILTGLDPYPDPPDPFRFTVAPVGQGFDPGQAGYFDLDGHDNIDLDLSTFTYGPGFPSLGQFVTDCVFEPKFLFISFDDDSAEAYWRPVAGPTDSKSPWNSNVFGPTTEHDEVIGLVVVPLPSGRTFMEYPFLNEEEVHPSLGPNPAPLTDFQDDDVDALDIRDGSCSVWYLSADHEAVAAYDPGWIYMKIPGPQVPIPVIMDDYHLGLPWYTDIDAFEFCWLWDSVASRNGLALLFSVNDDDWQTPFDESGGLYPGTIYYSFLNGTNGVFLDGYMEDIDAITIWETSLYADFQDPPPVNPCQPPSDVVLQAAGPGNYVISFTAPQTGSYNLYVNFTPNNNLAPPGNGWLLAGNTNVPGGMPGGFLYSNPAATYAKFVVTRSCP